VTEVVWKRCRSKSERGRKKNIILKNFTVLGRSSDYLNNREYSRIVFFTAREIYHYITYKDYILTGKYPAR